MTLTREERLPFLSMIVLPLAFAGLRLALTSGGGMAAWHVAACAAGVGLLFSWGGMIKKRFVEIKAGEHAFCGSGFAAQILFLNWETDSWLSLVFPFFMVAAVAAFIAFIAGFLFIEIVSLALDKGNFVLRGHVDIGRVSAQRQKWMGTATLAAVAVMFLLPGWWCLAAPAAGFVGAFAFRKTLPLPPFNPDQIVC